MNKNQTNSELGRRIDADLQARLAASSASQDHTVDSTEYLKETQKTSRFGWVWVLLIILAILSIILIVLI